LQGKVCGAGAGI